MGVKFGGQRLDFTLFQLFLGVYVTLLPKNVYSCCPADAKTHGLKWNIFTPATRNVFFYILQIGKTVPFSRVRHNHRQPPYSCQSPFSVDTQRNLSTDDI